MKRQPEITTKSVIVHALRLLWLHSRERRAALKRDGYSCISCHRKQSVAKGKEFKVQVHHVEGTLNWELMIQYIHNHLLVDPRFLETLCKECHKKETDANRNLSTNTSD